MSKKADVEIMWLIHPSADVPMVRGPVSTGRLTHLIGLGELADNDMVWTDGMPDWVALSEVMAEGRKKRTSYFKGLTFFGDLLLVTVAITFIALAINKWLHRDADRYSTDKVALPKVIEVVKPFSPYIWANTQTQEELNKFAVFLLGKMDDNNLASITELWLSTLGEREILFDHEMVDYSTGAPVTMDAKPWPVSHVMLASKNILFSRVKGDHFPLEGDPELVASSSGYYCLLLRGDPYKEGKARQWLVFMRQAEPFNFATSPQGYAVHEVHEGFTAEELEYVKKLNNWPPESGLGEGDSRVLNSGFY